MSAMMKRAMSEAFNYIFVASDPDPLLNHVLVRPIDKIVLLLKMTEVLIPNRGDIVTAQEAKFDGTYLLEHIAR